MSRVALVSILIFSLSAVASAADTRLPDAAMAGELSTVRELLEQKVDVNVQQGDGSTALHWAAYRDDVEMAELLIKAGAHVGLKTRLGDMSPLFMAAKNGSGRIVELLVKAGADAKSAHSGTGTTPLMLAAASGSVDAVRVLLDAGADANAKDVFQGQTALMFAAAPGRTEVIKLLAARGANVNAVSLVPDARRIEGAPAPRRGRDTLSLGGMAPLHFAAREGQIAAAAALVEAGADINLLTASNKMTALTIAILNARFDFAMELLKRGADPKPSSTEGISALYATVDAQWANRVWYPPPDAAEERTHYLDLMKELLARGADPNARLGRRLWHREFHGDWVDSAGATPFWRAAQANDVAALKLLVAGGANPSIPSTRGVSPLQVACGMGFEPQTSTYIPNGRLPTLRYLIEELGANVNAKDEKGYTPLHAAGLIADNEVVAYLVAVGADVQARSNMIFGGDETPNEDVPAGTGDTVADMANGPRPHNLVHPETVSFLEKLGSANSNNCRASTCVNKAKKDLPKTGGK